MVLEDDGTIFWFAFDRPTFFIANRFLDEVRDATVQVVPLEVEQDRQST